MKHDRVIQALQSFIDTDKYLYDDAPKGSSGEDRELVRALSNDCALEIAAQYRQHNTTSASVVVAILKQYEARIPELFLDTEDKEFAYELLCRLSAIAKVKKQYMAQNPVDAFLNAFMGTPVQETIHRQCLECGALLDIEVNARETAAPPFWLIIQCDTCNSIDYIDLPQGLSQMEMKGFAWLEMMEQSIFSRADAIERATLLAQGDFPNKAQRMFRY